MLMEIITETTGQGRFREQATAVCTYAAARAPEKAA